jgi:hypothetical protein
LYYRSTFVKVNSFSLLCGLCGIRLAAFAAFATRLAA